VLLRSSSSRFDPHPVRNSELTPVFLPSHEAGFGSLYVLSPVVWSI
jgi:hypothetical protein